jgi:phosphate-selective porin OprO and OprP
MKKRYSTRLVRLAAIATLVGSQSYGFYGHAAQLSDEDIQALIKKVNDLEQQVKVLQRDREVDQDTATDKAKQTPTVSLGVNGLTVQSADSNFTMIAHGYVQADDRTYFGEKTVPDTFLLRRVRPIIEGTVWKDVDYRLMLDFGSGNVSSSTANNVGVLDDAYVNLHYFSEAQIQIGKYKSPVGLERLQSTADLFFVETGFATELTPNYDLGISIHNDLWTSPIAYSIGIFDGAADNGSEDADVDEGKDVVGRLFAQPFIKKDGNVLQNLGFGAAGSIGTHTSGALTSYKTPGQQTFFSYNNVTPAGDQYRIDPQAFYFYGPFGIMGEYVMSSQKFKTSAAGLPPEERFNNTAWQVEASYFLTGEENSFKASSLKHVSPRHNFSSTLDGWGAFELVARIQQLAIDGNTFDTHGANTSFTAGSAHTANAWGAGLNWYLNQNLKFNIDYESTTFRGGTPVATLATVKPEQVILSQVQFSF